VSVRKVTNLEKIGIFLPAGRKLNFLVQEFNREFNTMGAKAGSAGVGEKIEDLQVFDPVSFADALF
jgi:uncharacterized protein YicC (UPF0701 family)